MTVDGVQEEYKVIVCGSSVISESQSIASFLDTLMSTMEEIEGCEITVYHGGCAGVDTFVSNYLSDKEDVKVVEMKPKATNDKGLKDHNTRMLEEVKPNMVIAFLNPDRPNLYSWDLIKKAVQFGHDVNIVTLRRSIIETPDKVH